MGKIDGAKINHYVEANKSKKPPMVASNFSP